MEEKVTREARKYVEKLFKKQDKLGSGSVTKEDMHVIMTQLLESHTYDKNELEDLMKNHVKEAKYTVHNKETNKFDVKYRQDTLDFPSVLAIGVKFLVKYEKGDQFSGTSMVQPRHFAPFKVERRPSLIHKRKIF